MVQKVAFGMLCVLPLVASCVRNRCLRSDPDIPICTGEIQGTFVDGVWVFDIVGLTEVVPDELTIRPRAVCNHAGAPVWEVSRLRADDYPIVYGQLPDGAREEAPAQPIRKNTPYSVRFSAGKRFNGGGSGTIGWAALFVSEEPDSFILTEDLCLDEDTGMSQNSGES